MSAYSDRRWAELARELEFNQLTELRRQAEGWRTGLTALTGLLAVLAVLKGRESLAELPQVSRIVAIGLVAGAFLLLMSGSVLAVRASHGRPGTQIILAGQALRRWTEQEIVRVGRSLRAAAACCVAGLLLVSGGIAVTWWNTDARPVNLVRVSTSETTLCGELVRAGPAEVTLWVGKGETRVRHTIPIASVSSVTPAESCA